MTFNPARKILEKIFYNLKDLKLIDNRCFPKNEIVLLACINYARGYKAKVGEKEFTGNKIIIPEHIYHLMLMFREMTGCLSHEYMSSNDVTLYSLKSVLNALCEILFWYKNFIDSLKKKN